MLMKVSMLVYLVPIATLMAGAFLGAALSGPLHINQSLASVVLGFLFMGMTFLVLRIYDRRSEVRGDGHHPRMTRILIRNDA
jgi:positive regulator of sigma E activity